MKNTLNLKLNSSKTKLKRLNKGIDFLGYFVKPHYVLVRKRVVKTLKKKLREFNRKEKVDYEQALAVVNSYLGHFRHADSHNLRKDIYENHLKALKDNFGYKGNYCSLKLS